MGPSEPIGDERGRTTIAVVVPCYRVGERVLEVLAGIGPEVAHVYCVDDACPDGSGDLIEERCRDPRVQVLRHERNQGVGGATRTGFRRALADGARVVVKLDGDGQMDPALIPRFVRPILAGRADYTKGNRFHEPSSVHGMPVLRVVGNAVLSFFNKLSSGYWNVFDPTNGFLAIHAGALEAIALDRVEARWFFESDLLFHLNIVQAVVEDVPMEARYGSEQSNLSPLRVGPEFLWKHCRNWCRRMLYNYYLRNFSVESVQLVLGLALLAFGTVFGANRWLHSERTQVPVTAGTVMLAGLPVLVGLQLLLSFLNGDTRNVPSVALQRRLDAQGDAAGAGR